jgi:serine/threonine-protein kinase
MLSGQYAFDGDSLPAILYRVINETPVSAAILRPGLPAELGTLLTRLLSKRPEDRPDARALATALHALASGTPAHVVAPPISNRVSRLLPILAFSTPVGVLLLIGLGIIVIEHFLPQPLQDAPSPSLNSTQLVQTTVPKLVLQEAQQTAPAQTDQLKPDGVQTQKAVPKKTPDPYLAGLDKKQVELRIQRTELLLKYTKQHPDVVEVDRQLEQLRIERKKYLRQQKKH